MSLARIMKKLWKKAVTPVTIMVIPHNSKTTLNLKVPSIGIMTCIVFCFIGTAYVFSKAVNIIEYANMEKKLSYYSSQFTDLTGTLATLKDSEREFKKLFSLKTKKEVLENLDYTNDGSADLESLKEKIAKTIESVTEIKHYLTQQKDIYRATPVGMPVQGRITSYYGMRKHPVDGKERFHEGVDISAEMGTPVRATADGIVSFSGWGGSGGNLVVLEHGFGFSSIYAHNKLNTLKVGQKVKKGDVVGYVGSTGNAQSPHVHYCILKNGAHINPIKYIQEEP